MQHQPHQPPRRRRAFLSIKNRVPSAATVRPRKSKIPSLLPHAPSQRLHPRPLPLPRHLLRLLPKTLRPIPPLRLRRRLLTLPLRRLQPLDQLLAKLRPRQLPVRALRPLPLHAHLDARGLMTQMHRRRRLVDLLPARPRPSHEPLRHVTAQNPQRIELVLNLGW